MGGGDVASDGFDSSNDVGEEVTLNISCSNGSKFSVQVNLNSTVEFFKSVLAQKCEIPIQQQRIIYRGRILKDDQTLHSYGVEADHTVHLVRGFAPAVPANTAATTDAGVRSTNSISTTDAGSTEGGPLEGSDFGSSLFPGLGLNGLGSGSGLFGVALPEIEQMQQQLTLNPNIIRDILNMPLVQNLMNNPETIRNLIMNNPQMREIMDRNPELGHILNDPATLRQTMEAARNPEIMREMMRSTDRAMSNIESSPEGFNMLRRMYENVQEPFLNATTLSGDSRSDLESDPFPPLLRAQSGRGNSNNSISAGPETTNNFPAPNTNPLPNPWASTGTGGTQTNLGARSNPTGDVSPISGGIAGLGFPDLERMLGSMPDRTSFNQIRGLNPQLQNQLRNMMQDPEFIRQLSSPEMMQDFQRVLSSQLGRQTSSEPGQNAGRTAGTAGNVGLDMLMNMFGGLGTVGGITTPNSSQVPPEELYSTQLSQLREMGFFDTQENIRALIATAGNVHAAVERLLGNLGQ